MFSKEDNIMIERVNNVLHHSEMLESKYLEIQARMGSLKKEIGITEEFISRVEGMQSNIDVSINDLGRLQLDFLKEALRQMEGKAKDES